MIYLPIKTKKILIFNRLSAEIFEHYKAREENKVVSNIMSIFFTRILLEL